MRQTTSSVALINIVIVVMIFIVAGSSTYEFISLLHQSRPNTNINTSAFVNTIENTDVVNINKAEAKLLSNTSVPLDNSNTPLIITGWKTYTNVRYTYSFQYPSDWVLEATAGDQATNVRVHDPKAGEVRLCFDQQNMYPCDFNAVIAEKHGAHNQNPTWQTTDSSIAIDRLLLGTSTYTYQPSPGDPLTCENCESWMILGFHNFHDPLQGYAQPLGWDTFGDIALLAGSSNDLTTPLKIIKSFRVTQATLTVDEVIQNSAAIDQSNICIYGAYQHTTALSVLGKGTSETTKNGQLVSETVQSPKIWVTQNVDSSLLRCLTDTTGQSSCVGKMKLCGNFSTLKNSEPSLGPHQDIRYRLN